MGKRKEEKMLRQQSDVEALFHKYQEQLARVDDGFSSLKDMPDASQKILKLLELSGVVSSMSCRFENDFEKIADQHVREDRKFNKSGLVSYRQRLKKEIQLREKNPGIAAMEKAISDKSSPIEKLLSETTRSCHGNLAEVASSPFYPEAWKEHEPLRDLFAAAKAAREALGDDVPAATPAAPIKKAPTLRRD